MPDMYIDQFYVLPQVRLTEAICTLRRRVISQASGRLLGQIQTEAPLAGS